MEETVDIVSPDNKVLYQAAKTEAHQKGLLHRTVIAEIIDSKGRWTLVKQANDRQDAGQFVSPVGGHARTGETEEQTLKREALEETGLADFKFKRVGQVIYNRKVLGRQENHFFILYEIYSDEPLKLNQESVSCKTFTKAELKQEIKNNKQIFGDALFAIVESFYPELMD